MKNKVSTFFLRNPGSRMVTPTLPYHRRAHLRRARYTCHARTLVTVTAAYHDTRLGFRTKIVKRNRYINIFCLSLITADFRNNLQQWPLF